MKILQLCPRIPYPPHDGGAIAMYDVTSNLHAEGHEVTVLAINTPKHFQPAKVLEDKARVIAIPVNTDLSKRKAFLNLFKAVPYNIERFISQDVERALTELLQKKTFDIIQVEGLFMAYYVDLLKQLCQAPVIMRSHNVEYLIWERLAANEQNPLKKIYLKYLATGIRNFEKTYLNKFDAIAAITEEDKTRMRELGCTVPIEFIPAGVEITRFKNDPEIKAKPQSLFIISSLNWLPNLEGIDWFLENVWKTVAKTLPKLELHLAGKSPPKHLLELNLPNVFVHGFVPSASEFMQQYDLMLVPLLSGGGMRIKIIEGMALGKCILTTPVGAEGIFCENGKDILISEKPEAWVKYITDYYEGNLPVKTVGENAQKLATQVYDNKRIIRKFLKLYEEHRP
ncbi:glycosyltransferase family 4 protein [Adhaeribacter sp. BT258]|uniref:Glycosyltransferase family 4 protein n=1 Tax=Adhaeribacter terrigena TaxID=2793070 RepID=A0ABS1BYL7_9BACT|nr:glycosyltransferase family 4 protein [Adhaeribacter terrigena]MBK0402265.1 glycosyltransferase family 4 protein [Adhaeribacter terrigena]